jgi:tetratricopeptide (TPR) repeat protein
MSDQAGHTLPVTDDTENPANRTSTRPGKGFRIGEYTVVDTLGHGSMATVYLARDSTGHEVALKIFQEGPGVSPTMLERFKREAEASKKLRRHPNIMKVYSTGQDGVFHYIVMEPIRNSRTFEDVVEAGQLDRDTILAVTSKIARALHYAHSRNIVHRDVKPSNIMIDEFGEPQLTDFGVAALIDWPSCTLSGALTGTPLYMSPEQARADKVGPAGDIYSLGVVLYEALTGMLPYSTQHAAPVKNVLEAVKNEIPRRPRFFRKDISPDLEAVVLKALQKDPDDRYSDADYFADDLERVRTGRHVTARISSVGTRVAAFLRRHDQLVVAGMVMVIMASAAGLFFRHKLLEARYDKLLTTAHLRSFILRPANIGEELSESAQPSGAWQEIRSARRAMNSGNWSAALSGFAAAAELARAVGDQRTVALAQLDQARCAQMLDDHELALTRLREILQNDDASPAVAELAHLEALVIALLQGKQTDAVALLQLRALPSDGPIRDLVRCLAGEISTRAFSDSITRLPQRLRNDAHLILAVRYRMDGDAGKFAAELRRAQQESSPASDWPAPLAKKLLASFRG